MLESKSLDATEALGAKGAKHPRVTLADMEAAIKTTYWVRADQFLAGDQKANTPELSLMTLCFVVMKNGFVVIGKSAPASPENFDAAKGNTFAYEDAIRQLWPLMGFALRERLAADEGR